MELAISIKKLQEIIVNTRTCNMNIIKKWSYKIITPLDKQSNITTTNIKSVHAAESLPIYRLTK